MHFRSVLHFSSRAEDDDNPMRQRFRRWRHRIALHLSGNLLPDVSFLVWPRSEDRKSRVEMELSDLRRHLLLHSVCMCIFRFIFMSFARITVIRDAPFACMHA